ncbi:DUF1707 domain-containing protein [Actinosynnema sp. NPDC020468]|uniref:DUF1707 SHOCT-like domain-containing protein n=1 Tax=Actinosynnema sp. NPDC020468 TaxID=3154488 RepID=UPI0033CD20D4
MSDAEREHVVGVLQKAIGRGLLTLDEFTERTDTALAAKTRGQLNAVLLDLPGVVHDEQTVVVASQENVEFKATLSTVKRRGPWVVPRTIVLRTTMGSADLDFREAVIPHAVVDIELDLTAGSLKMVVPDGASVDTDGLELSAGSVKDKGGRTAGGRPHFVVRGVVKAGSVEIKRKRSILRNA